MTAAPATRAALRSAISRWRDDLPSRIRSPALAGTSADVFNPESGAATMINDFAAVVRECAARRSGSRHEPPRPAEVRRRVADLGASRAGLGYEPRVVLRAGLTDHPKWLAGM